MLRTRTGAGNGCEGAERDDAEQGADGSGCIFHDVTFCCLMF